MRTHTEAQLAGLGWSWGSILNTAANTANTILPVYQQYQQIRHPAPATYAAQPYTPTYTPAQTPAFVPAASAYPAAYSAPRASISPWIWVGVAGVGGLGLFFLLRKKRARR